MAELLKDGELLLYGTVGRGFFAEEGFTALEVVNALAEIGRSKDVTVRLNSGGGFASEGVAIFSALDSHRGKVTVVVDAVAASAASIIAMAGDEVVMRTGAVMMIHDPAMITLGTSEDHAKSVELLETVADSMADIYAEKTERPADDIRAEMKAETWMTAREAVAKGFADRVEKGRSKEPTAFDYRLYQNAPERMVALATKRDWTLRADAEEAPDGAAHHRQEEESMANDTASGAATETAATETELVVTASVETSEQITARVRADEQKRSADIVAACTLVGKPEKAVAFIAEGKSLSEVVAALQGERAASDKDEVTARHNAAIDTDVVSLWDDAAKLASAKYGVPLRK